MLLFSCGPTSTDATDAGVNMEHVAKLTEGVVSWNDWRSQNRDVVPNLRGADLAQANLEGYNLSRAILSNANLSIANLSGANFTNANLRGADLSMANLSNANFSGTRYDTRTKWPARFDPIAAGARLVSQ
ncbi:MAG: pentapeptide repeat-containing protein [Chloroflexi bacterium]|nr:pentapeptide repeat-containing protein [Chloroflexota bacterium]